MLDELGDRLPAALADGELRENRQQQEDERKNREQRVVRDRGREREVAAVVELVDAAPRRLPAEAPRPADPVDRAQQGRRRRHLNAHVFPYGFFSEGNVSVTAA